MPYSHLRFVVYLNFSIKSYYILPTAEGITATNRCAPPIQDNFVPYSIHSRKLQSAGCRGIIPPTKARVFYGENTVRLPRQDLTQARHTKLYNAIPPFATGLPLLYYPHTTFQNNHLLPQHDTKQHSRLHLGGGCFSHCECNPLFVLTVPRILTLNVFVPFFYQFGIGFR